MWQSIETAPQTGEHILGADFTPGRIGFGMCGGKHQSMMTTVHWWNNPGEEGWYISCSQNDSSEPFPATHWQPLIELAAHAPKQEPIDAYCPKCSELLMLPQGTAIKEPSIPVSRLKFAIATSANLRGDQLTNDIIYLIHEAEGEK